MFRKKNSVQVQRVISTETRWNKTAGKAFPNKSWRKTGRTECWAYNLPLKIGTTARHNFQLYAPAALYPQGNSLVLISVRVFMTPGLLNEVRRNRSLEDFQGPCLESNPEPPVSLHTQAIAPQFAPSYRHSVAPKASKLCLNQSQLLKNIPKNNSKAL